MNPLNFGLRHPITVMVGMAAIAIGSIVAYLEMQRDVFPDLNMPVIYVAQAYGGMDSAQMEGLITSYYEMVFLYMNGIDHVESKNIQNLALVKLYFHPGTDMVQAMAEAAIYANRVKAYFPPGTVPPFIMRMDASSVPVSFLVLSSETRSISELSDMMLFRVRPNLANIRGATAPQPFGGSLRTIVVYLDPEQLRDKNLSPQEVAAALNNGNTITPSGNARVQDTMPIVSINSLVIDPQDLGNIPIKPEQSVYLRDLGRIEDGSDIATGFALVNGRRSIYMPIVKTSDASTLAVVNGLKDNLDKMRSVLPEDVKLTLEFDQSTYVSGAINGVRDQCIIGGLLTGLIVMLFLRDWRTVIVVLLTIPLALMGAVLGLWAVGQTINLMTLGGLSLAVGILINTATVVIENIHTHMAKSSSIAEAVKNGASETIVPILLAMLCILAVFAPSFLMEGAAKGLFVPLAFSVGFAMITAFVLSTTFIPVLSIWLIRLRRTNAEESGGFSLDRLREAYSRFCQALMRIRFTLSAVYLNGSVLALLFVGGLIGREIAPSVDSGQFQLRIRAPAGTRLRISEEIAREALEVVKDVAGPENVDISVAYVGVTAPTYTVNAIFLWTGGTDQSVTRISLRKGSGLRVAEVREKLREELPKRLVPWLEHRLLESGYGPEEAAVRAEKIRFAFEPADVVNQVMSFGAPAPVEVVISGPDLDVNRAYGERIQAEMAKIPSLRDLQFGQIMDYPRINVNVDRERAGLAGVTVAEASTAMIAATSSSRYVLPIFWADPKSGIGYQVQLEVPPGRVDSSDQVGMIPVKRTKEGGQVLMRDIAKISKGIMPEEYDRLNQLRYVSLTANVEGEDLGHASDRIKAAIAAAGDPPRGVRVEIRGQVTPMLQMFQGLGIGLGIAVVLIFLLLMAYFQSLRLAVVALATVPAVIVGVVVALWITHTTMNIESFMGVVMAIGIAVANAILLVTFAERYRGTGKAVSTVSSLSGSRDWAAIPAFIIGLVLTLYVTHTILSIVSLLGVVVAVGIVLANAILLVMYALSYRTAGKISADAAVNSARDRLRSILMASCAMIAGMIPMAIGFGQGGEQTAPLGRAVVGGLIAATLATLFVLPAIFAVVIGKSKARSPSLHPDDPESSYFSPNNTEITTDHSHDSVVA